MDPTDYDVVDLGCGQNKREGALGVDIVDTPATDLVIDLDEYPWDLPTDSYSEVVCFDVIEHVSQPLRFMEEVYRIATDGAVVHLKTPHFTNNNMWVDPTHKRPFSAFTFRDYFTAEDEYSFYTDAVFDPISIRIAFEPARKLPWNVLGRFVANRWPWFYEKTVLRSLFPAQSLRIKLAVQK